MMVLPQEDAGLRIGPSIKRPRSGRNLKVRRSRAGAPDTRGATQLRGSTALARRFEAKLHCQPVVQVAISSTGERIAHGSSRWRRSETLTPAEDYGIVDETPHCAEHDRESSHAALEGAWCAHAEERPHPKAQVERAGMHEQSLQHVFVTTHMRSPERTRLVEMRTRALEQFPTSAKQSLSTFAADPASVRIHGVSLRAPESDDADVHALIHTADECLLEKP
jgi:hypothetical protein